MLYVAKMHTNYPEFHGSGYYNFVMSKHQDDLNDQIEMNSHDFRHIKTVKTRFATVENLLKKYPTKQSLNEALFQ